MKAETVLIFLLEICPTMKGLGTQTVYGRELKFGLEIVLELLIRQTTPTYLFSEGTNKLADTQPH